MSQCKDRLASQYAIGSPSWLVDYLKSLPTGGIDIGEAGIGGNAIGGTGGLAATFPGGGAIGCGIDVIVGGVPKKLKTINNLFFKMSVTFNYLEIKLGN